jgi:hypothetical protein
MKELEGFTLQADGGQLYAVWLSWHTIGTPEMALAHHGTATHRSETCPVVSVRDWRGRAL